MKLDHSLRAMGIGTPMFNFMRTLMLTGAGGADPSECFLAAFRIRDGEPESWAREWAAMADKVYEAAVAAKRQGQTVAARDAYQRASNYYRAAVFSLAHDDARLIWRPA